MSKIMKRPMFRRGGEVTEGIVNMAMPRRQYAESNYDDLKKQFPGQSGVIDKAIADTALMQGFVGRPGGDPLANLLIRGGLKTLAAKPRGSTLQTIAGAFEEPTAEALKAKEKEDLFMRQLRLAGVTGAIKQREKLEQIATKGRYQYPYTKDRSFNRVVEDSSKALVSKYSKDPDYQYSGGLPEGIARNTAQFYAGKDRGLFKKELKPILDKIDINKDFIKTSELVPGKDPGTYTITDDAKELYRTNFTYFNPQDNRVYLFDGTLLKPVTPQLF